MGSYESAVYYDYKTLWEQKKITKEVYETALAIDSDRDGLNIFEFNRLLQKYPEAEERKKNLIPDMDITFKDKLNYSIDKALPDHIENSPIISNKEKAKLKRRNLIAGSSAVLGLSGTTMMCLSKMNDLPRKLSTAIGVTGFLVASLSIATALVNIVSASILTKKLENKIEKSEGN